MTAQKTSSERRTAAWIGALLPLLLFVVLLMLRAGKVDAMVGAYTGCMDCMFDGVLHHDMLTLALLALLLGLALLVPWRWLCWLLRLVAVVLVLAWAADFALFAALTQRLYLGDVLMFGGEGHALGGFVAAMLRAPDRLAWVGAAALVVVLSALSLWPSRSSFVRGATLLVLAGAAAIAYLAPLATSRYVHPEVFDNLFEVNLGNTGDARYSPGYRADLAAHPPHLAQVCTAAMPSTKPSVILVLVESLSAYHSKLLGGDMDALPKLDALARANHYFTDFLANGFTTNGGRIALYTGRAPLPPPGLGRTLPLKAYGFTRDTLVDYAHRAGYTAHYFTSGDLGFVDSKPWLDGLGFDSVEGSESPFYRGMKRWQFDAPEDHALFARVLDWIDKRDDARPFIATLLTVSSHPPFVDPVTGKVDQLDTFRYVDAQLAWFHDQLAARGFFKHGLLLVTGDHRSMTPLRASEWQRWGESAYARVPMVVIGAVDMPQVVTQPFAQSDFPLSFARFAGLPACRDQGHGSFLRHDPQAATFLLHASGQERDRVDVFFGGHDQAAYFLDGDDGAWQGDKPGGWQMIRRSIDAQRVREAEIAARAEPGS
jgi:hypothetical protein